MTNKRILVRVINHARGIDIHEMQMAPAEHAEEIACIMVGSVAQDSGYPITLPTTSLIDGGEMHGDALHSTYYNDGWLLQLRIDDKKINGQTLAANDNHPILAQANS